MKLTMVTCMPGFCSTASATAASGVDSCTECAISSIGHCLISILITSAKSHIKILFDLPLATQLFTAIYFLVLGVKCFNKIFCVI